jgi:hypothetical protein
MHQEKLQVLVFGMDFLLVISYWGMVNKEPMSVPFLVDMFGLDIVLVPVLVDRLHLALESSMETTIPTRFVANCKSISDTRTRLYISTRQSPNSISRTDFCSRKGTNFITNCVGTFPGG